MGMILSRDQRKAIITCATAAGEGGKFVFITGKAGTGKSTVLRALRSSMNIVVAAPTGIAAINVDGITCHRLFNLRTGLSEPERTPAAKDVVKSAEAIVIDEVSMVRADIMDAIDHSLRKRMECDRPFGGKTILAFGDLWQLPPVATRDEWIHRAPIYKSPFFFDAKVFAGATSGLGFESDPVEIQTTELNEVFRQIGDSQFVDALNLIRMGDPAGLTYINTRVGEKPSPIDMPVTIVMTNRRADEINAARLATLDTESRVYESDIEGEFGNDVPVAQKLNLKIGAQVMFAKNMTCESTGEYAANGMVGEVVGFGHYGPFVRLANGNEIQATPQKWEKKTYEKGENGLDEKVDGVYEQVPLKLAWAISTHKSQGQTLESAFIEIENSSRTHGQTYVALSRVKSMEGLFLRRPLNKFDLCVDPAVKSFFAPPVASRFAGVAR
jgi:ATP-dependent DNA helicase PIF1